jgi:hypothetical protein
MTQQEGCRFCKRDAPQAPARHQMEAYNKQLQQIASRTGREEVTGCSMQADSFSRRRRCRRTASVSEF